MRTFTADERAEIQGLYRGAKAPSKQIGVIAELYACSRGAVEVALGLRVPVRRPPPPELSQVQPVARAGKTHRVSSAKQAEAVRMVILGATMRQVGAQMGVSFQSVSYWVKCAARLDAERGLCPPMKNNMWVGWKREQMEKEKRHGG